MNQRLLLMLVVMVFSVNISIAQNPSQNKKHEVVVLIEENASNVWIAQIDDCFFLVTVADIQEIVNSKVASFEACQPGSEKLANLLACLDLKRDDIQAAMIFKTNEETQLPEKYARYICKNNKS